MRRPRLRCAVAVVLGAMREEIMARNGVVIQMGELPERARDVTVAELQAVYGGCSDWDGPCQTNCDCCGYQGVFGRAVQCWSNRCTQSFAL